MGSEGDVLVDESACVCFQLVHYSLLDIDYQLPRGASLPFFLQFLFELRNFLLVCLFPLLILELDAIEFFLSGCRGTLSCFSRCLILMRSFWFLSSRVSYCVFSDLN